MGGVRIPVKIIFAHAHYILSVLRENNLDKHLINLPGNQSWVNVKRKCDHVQANIKKIR